MSEKSPMNADSPAVQAHLTMMQGVIKPDGGEQPLL